MENRISDRIRSNENENEEESDNDNDSNVCFNVGNDRSDFQRIRTSENRTSKIRTSEIRASEIRTSEKRRQDERASPSDQEPIYHAADEESDNSDYERVH